MSTYVMTQIRVPGVPRVELLDYMEQIEATMQPHGGRYLAVGEGEALEGAWPGLGVLLEFPDRAAINAWYGSPAYQGIMNLRQNSVVSDIFVIDGLPEGVTAADVAVGLRASLPA
jgi:uncharacterized protein (DUF1330 family)